MISRETIEKRIAEIADERIRLHAARKEATVQLELAAARYNELSMLLELCDAAEEPEQAPPPIAARKRGALRDALLAVVPPRQHFTAKQVEERLVAAGYRDWRYATISGTLGKLAWGRYLGFDRGYHDGAVHYWHDGYGKPSAR
jgi:hypothetical protein